MKKNYFYIIIVSLLIASCNDDSMRTEIPTESAGREIRLRADIDQANISRANDSGFADGDRIGVFAVNFAENNNPGALAPTGNLANNVRFTYSESSLSWMGDRQLYFEDDKTPVDFYGYYPYNNSVNEVSQYPFSVNRDQSGESTNGSLSNYEESDFLWAKTCGVTPSSSFVSLTFRHILAGVQVTLIPGEGFDDSEWSSLDKSVLIDNTKRNAHINLASGIATAVGDVDEKSIVMNQYKDDFRAVVIPQTVNAEATLLQITVGGQSYSFARTEAMNFLPSKLHKFTIEVNKSIPSGDYEFNLINEAITAWESDLTSHNGKVKEYIIVDVPEAGGLEYSINEANLKPEEITNLKIRGELNQEDFEFMRLQMKYVEALNLKDVIIRHCEIEYGKWEDYCIPNEAFKGMKYLAYFTFPNKLIKVGNDAFLGTILTGALDIPEGVEYIGSRAFQSTFWDGFSENGFSPEVHCNFTGNLYLPSTLKYIGASAFENCDFTGPLILPESIECIGESSFADCEYFSGELILPTSLNELGKNAFANTNFTGNFKVPRHISRIESFFFPKIVSISWPEYPTEIAEEAFRNTSLCGDIKIPESITHIGRAAFANTNISHIIFPLNLEFLEENVCAMNSNLQDTVVIPPLIETIGERAFAQCEKLDAVILPKKLQRIKNGAFENCFSLSYIHCQAVDPPVLEESAFYGVNKDNFTVEVPEGSVDAYRNAPGWKEFKRIASYKNFIARPSKFNVLNKGGKLEIVLNADDDWEMTECPDWCDIDKKSGSKKTVINLTVKEMNHGLNDRFGIISFRLKNDTEHVTHINVGQYDYEYDEDSCCQIQAATKGKGIDLLFIGDGYDAIDISKGLYLEDMKQEMEYLFGVEPYITYRDYFNVFTSFALSEDSGVEDVNHWRRTKFHTAITNSDQRLTSDWMSALDYSISTVPSIANSSNPTACVIMVANSGMYEGKTYSVGDSFCAVVTKSTLDYPNDARGLIQHEAGGHGIGWLADEYMYHSAFIQKCICTDGCGHVNELLDDQSWGFGLNVSLKGKYKEVPWTHLIFNKSYGDIVDIYEGGYFHSRGVFRSEYNSCMNNNVPYFSTWSRQLIVQRIMKLAGEEFSLDEFYAKDKRDMGRDFTSTRRGDANDAAIPALHGNPPVFIKNYKFGKKGGKK